MSATSGADDHDDRRRRRSDYVYLEHFDRDEAERRAACFIGATRVPKAQPQSGDNNDDTSADIVEADILEADVRAATPGRYFSGRTQVPTIYTVPRQLAMSNPRAYTPFVVRLGFIGPDDSRSRTPYHIEKYKTSCVRRLITGRNQAGPGHQAAWTPAEGRLLRKCLATLKRLVPRIRSAHDPNNENKTMLFENDDIVAEQSLRDGCFVLHRLLKYSRIAKRAEQGSSGGDDDHDDDDDWTLVFGQCWVWGFVTYDLLLLQNQIPFFVLQALFEHLKSQPDEQDDVLITGALQLFRSLHPHGQHSSPIACREVHHLLHLFYLSISFPTPTPAPGDPKASTRREHVLPSELPLWVPCAKELEEAGVLLRARKRGAISFLDVRFHGGVLEMPPLQLYDYSESMFRNLIAFEQTYPATPGHITAYASFMACLVTTHEDMRLLNQSGILVNHMSSGDRDATRFFGSISAQVHTSVDLNYLAGVMEEVVKYQSGRWPRWRAFLVRNYFSNPWVIMSVAAAVFLLCLTMVQTFFAAYAYFKPPAS